MKTSIKLVLLFLLPVFAAAQGPAVTITNAMFNKPLDNAYLAPLDGWVFKHGSDTAWAKTDIDVSGWKKLKPIELSAKYADKNGRVEGWFRIKIKFDKAFGDKSFAFKSGTWAACDLYVDGTRAASFGNTGSHFHEFRPFHNILVPANLKPGREYTLALHVVDYLAPFPPGRLRSEDIGLSRLLQITGPKYNAQFLLVGVKLPAIFNTIWISISTLLCLFFWLLFIQNRFEKNLHLIAVGSTFFVLGIFGLSSVDEYFDLTYTVYIFYNIISILSISIAFIMALLILVNIFNRVVGAGLKIFIGVFLLGINLSNTFLKSIGGPLAGCLLLLLFAVYIYYIISSRKKLRGAQWAIVFGLCFSLVFISLYIVLFVALTAHNIFFYYLLITGYALSFPLSLLVYVVIRFKEIVMEVKQNAGQVMQLSEEKKRESLTRQKILQEVVARQTAEIRTTLEYLKATQTQLIQSEKMASLGELTAGIAHEIQNPLNFVNNFSEVNKEMLEELETEIKKGNTEDALALTADIIQNEEKISQHGKRADSIVKGMLEHSRASTGQKELTDLNKLADEYLRLAYHGLRAKDKSFNADLITRLDEKLPPVSVVQQDIGRVLLNLFNNAFYAVKQKAKTAGADYKPEVSVTTFTPPSGGWGFKVKDNGIGIPDAIKDKIMQPFFTTKPTGEGTGLGLSLTYDMVVKGHGGSIQVNSVEGGGSEFIVSLPI
jgi:signal transduction histidine kinase